jgi:hypothetical protein
MAQMKTTKTVTWVIGTATAVVLAGGAAAGATMAAQSSSAPAPRPSVTQTVTAAPATTTPPPPQVVINNNPAPAPVYVAPAPVQVPVYVPAPGQTDPWAVVSAYYGDIESGDYTDAWNLQSPSFQGSEGNYQGWMAGYANTGQQTLTEDSESGDTVSVNLAAVNTATGVTQYFTGSFTVDGGLITSGSMTQTG